MTDQATLEALEALDTLRAARDLIARPEHWTQEAAARTDTGAEVPAKDPYATKWCLWGACQYTAPYGPALRDALTLLEITVPEVHRVGVTKFNDTHTHKQVLRVLDRTIKNERGT